jgi:hypothetical protein
MFVSCGHYYQRVTWNEFCVTCGIKHKPYRIYWHKHDPKRAGIPKNYCGYCGAKMIAVRIR